MPRDDSGILLGLKAAMRFLWGTNSRLQMEADEQSADEARKIDVAVAERDGTMHRASENIRKMAVASQTLMQAAREPARSLDEALQQIVNGQRA